MDRVSSSVAIVVLVCISSFIISTSTATITSRDSHFTSISASHSASISPSSSSASSASSLAHSRAHSFPPSSPHFTPRLFLLRNELQHEIQQVERQINRITALAQRHKHDRQQQQQEQQEEEEIQAQFRNQQQINEETIDDKSSFLPFPSHLIPGPGPASTSLSLPLNPLPPLPFDPICTHIKCHHHGQCKPTTSISTSSNIWRCKCNEGWSGRECETQIEQEKEREQEEETEEEEQDETLNSESVSNQNSDADSIVAVEAESNVDEPTELEVNAGEGQLADEVDFEPTKELTETEVNNVETGTSTKVMNKSTALSYSDDPTLQLHLYASPSTSASASSESSFSASASAPFASYILRDVLISAGCSFVFFLFFAFAFYLFRKRKEREYERRIDEFAVRRNGSNTTAPITRANSKHNLNRTGSASIGRVHSNNTGLERFLRFENGELMNEDENYNNGAETEERRIVAFRLMNLKYPPYIVNVPVYEDEVDTQG